MNIQALKQRFGIIGNAPALNHALKTASLVAGTDLSVLISGASGVGKESFSKIIHALSSRKHQKFIAINCGALPESTLYSELFGHTKNAFTGATSERKGYFETVNGGTIFLDEIGEMPLQLQQFLLRVLEQGEYVKMGSNKVESTDVRIIAATNVKLEEYVKKGKFREDLYYRLNTVPIKVPPLKERVEDIALLFRKFAADFAERYKTTPVRLDDRAQLLLENYDWPGNIRELKNLADQISVLTEEKLIQGVDLLDFIPKLSKRNLPMIADQMSGSEQNSSSNHGFYEREILFKFLYEMKKDINDVKSLIAEIAKTNDLEMPHSIPQTDNKPTTDYVVHSTDHRSHSSVDADEESYTTSDSIQPIIINTTKNNADFSDVEEIEESLSLEDMEKDMIKRALSKYKGKRKEAAKELGISERTLYRKIRQYALDQ